MFAETKLFASYARHTHPHTHTHTHRFLGWQRQLALTLAKHSGHINFLGCLPKSNRSSHCPTIVYSPVTIQLTDFDTLAQNWKGFKQQRQQPQQQLTVFWAYLSDKHIKYKDLYYMYIWLFNLRALLVYL